MDNYWDWLPAFRWGETAQEIFTPPSPFFSGDTLIKGLSNLIVWVSSFMWRIMLWALRAALSSDLPQGASSRINHAVSVSGGVILSAILGVVVVASLVYMGLQYLRRRERTSLAKDFTISMICLALLVSIIAAAGVSDRERQLWEERTEEARIRRESFLKTKSGTSTSFTESQFNAADEPPPSPSFFSPGWLMERASSIATTIGTSVGEVLRIGDTDTGLTPLQEDSIVDKSPLDCNNYIAELNRRSDIVARTQPQDSFGSAPIARAMSDLWVASAYSTYATAQWGSSAFSSQVFCRILEARSKQQPFEQLQVTIDAASGPVCDQEYVQAEDGEFYLWEWTNCEESSTSFWLGDWGRRILSTERVTALDIQEVPEELQTITRYGQLTGLGRLDDAVGGCANHAPEAQERVEIWARIPEDTPQYQDCRRLASFIENFTLGVYETGIIETSPDNGADAWMELTLYTCGATQDQINSFRGLGGEDNYTSWNDVLGSGQADLQNLTITRLADCLRAMGIAVGVAESSVPDGIEQKTKDGNDDWASVCSPYFCQESREDERNDEDAEGAKRIDVPFTGVGIGVNSNADSWFRFNFLEDLVPNPPPEEEEKFYHNLANAIVARSKEEKLSDPFIDGSTIQSLIDSAAWIAKQYTEPKFEHFTWVVPRFFFSLVLSGFIYQPEDIYANLALYPPESGGRTPLPRTTIEDLDNYGWDVPTKPLRVLQEAFSQDFQTRYESVVRGAQTDYLPNYSRSNTSEIFAFDINAGDDEVDVRLSESLDFNYPTDGSYDTVPDPDYSPGAAGQILRTPVNYDHGLRIANFWTLCVPEAPDAAELRALEARDEGYEKWRETNPDESTFFWRIREDFADIIPLVVSRNESTNVVDTDKINDLSPSSRTLEDYFIEDWGHVCAAVWSGVAGSGDARAFYCNRGFAVIRNICETRQVVLNLFGLGRSKFVANDVTDVRPLGGGIFELTTDQVQYSLPVFNSASEGGVVAGISPDAEIWLEEANNPSGPGTQRLTASVIGLMVTTSMFFLMGIIILLVLGSQIALLLGFALLPLILFLGIIPSERTRQILTRSTALIGFSMLSKILAALVLSLAVLTVWVITVLSYSVFSGFSFRWTYLLTTFLACIIMVIYAKKLLSIIKQVAKSTGVDSISAPISRGLQSGKRKLAAAPKALSIKRKLNKVSTRQSLPGGVSKPSSLGQGVSSQKIPTTGYQQQTSPGSSPTGSSNSQNKYGKQPNDLGGTYRKRSDGAPDYIGGTYKERQDKPPFAGERNVRSADAGAEKARTQTKSASQSNPPQTETPSQSKPSDLGDTAGIRSNARTDSKTANAKNSAKANAEASPIAQQRPIPKPSHSEVKQGVTEETEDDESKITISKSRQPKIPRGQSTPPPPAG